MDLIADAFAETLQRIELNPTRVAVASQRYNAVKATIEGNLPGGATVRRIGSFQRSTKIRPLDLSDQLDVDALVVLGEARNYAVEGRGVLAKDALARVRNALRADRTYRLMDPQTDAPAIVLEYADAFKMEIAVGYVELRGEYPRAEGPPCYLVAGAGNRWIPADYDYDAQVISGWNQTSLVHGTLVPAIKLLKRWIRTNEVPLKSFHVEILVTATLLDAMRRWDAEGKWWDYRHLIAEFLAQANRYLIEPIAFAGSHTLRVDSGFSSDGLKAIGTYLHERGQEAWDLCRMKDLSSARRRWRAFFGEPFPTELAA